MKTKTLLEIVELVKKLEAEVTDVVVAKAATEAEWKRITLATPDDVILLYEGYEGQAEVGEAAWCNEHNWDNPNCWCVGDVYISEEEAIAWQPLVEPPDEETVALLKAAKV